MMTNLEKRQKKAAGYAFGKILDVGCSGQNGFNRFLEGDVIGFDIIDVVNDSDNYREIVKGDANEISKYFPSGSFDTIIAMELLEHLINPVNFLKMCHSLIRDNGILILSTPTPFYFSTVIGNVMFRRGLSSQKEHYTLWAPRTLNKVANDMGFSVEDVVPAFGFYKPFFTWQLIYIYRKVAA